MVNTQNHGFIFATTGEGYTDLAIQAAKTVKQHHPDHPIDLYTDTPVDDPVFDQVHALNTVWHRPKMEALYRSRFERTIYLDADLLVIADISDIFDLLDHFDIAAAHDQNRNWKSVVKCWSREMPASFPQYNAGLIGVKRNPNTDELFHKWEQSVGAAQHERDQPAMRELLYLSTLRIATLPAEYNLMNIKQLPCWQSTDCAPRVIHHPRFHGHIKADQPRIRTLQELLGGEVAQHIAELAATDYYLTKGNAGQWVHPLCDMLPEAKQRQPVTPTDGCECVSRCIRYPHRWSKWIKRGLGLLK